MSLSLLFLSTVLIFELSELSELPPEDFLSFLEVNAFVIFPIAWAVIATPASVPGPPIPGAFLSNPNIFLIISSAFFINQRTTSAYKGSLNAKSYAEETNTV